MDRGRGQEVPGEDAFVCGRYGAAYVRGMQTEDENGYVRAVASPKHFVGYGESVTRHRRSRLMHLLTCILPFVPYQPDHIDMDYSQFDGVVFNRHNFSVNSTAQEMVEYFLLPFELVIAEGHAKGLMVSAVAAHSTHC